MRCFKTIRAYTTEDLDVLINSFAATCHVVNVDVHCYESQWYAFILYEEVGSATPG